MAHVTPEANRVIGYVEAVSSGGLRTGRRRAVSLLRLRTKILQALDEVEELLAKKLRKVALKDGRQSRLFFGSVCITAQALAEIGFQAHGAQDVAEVSLEMFLIIGVRRK